MKVLFVSLGCDKNTVDSEKILKRFTSKYNFDIALTPFDADVVVINTCSFIHDAKKESIDYIKYFTKLKKQGVIKKILVLGCLVAENIKTKEYDNLFKDVDAILSLDKYLDELGKYDDRMHDVLSFSSSLKISDGCNKFCSYCIIPYLKGRYKSIDPKFLLRETKKLAKAGTKELSIVGQDTLYYGMDLVNSGFKNTKRPIVELINNISKVTGIEWIRLLYCYPEEIDDSVIELIKYNNKVLPYIDMPIQHISDKILKVMNRKTTRKKIIDVIAKLRKEIPNICIRTTIIVGFPGETEKEFDELSEFVKEIKFDKLGVFCYSREKLSKSYNYPYQVDEKTKNKRRKILLDIQKKTVTEKNKQKIGFVYNAIVEGKDLSRKDTYIVRPYFNARDIDDKVYVKTKETLISGTFVNVEIKKAISYDLEGVII